MSKLLNFFLQLTTQIKIYHWQTRYYAKHKTADKLNISINSLSDKFVEIYIRKYGRPKLNEQHSNIKVANLNDIQFVHYLRKTIEFLRNDVIKYVDVEKDCDLINIRDQLLGEIAQTLHLLTFE